MLFPTVEYALFFLLSLFISWSLTRWPNLHKTFLLVASYVFYAAFDWRYVPLLFVISAVAGFAGRRIQLARTDAARKWLLGAAATLFVLVLVYFKYISFLFMNVAGVLAQFGKRPAWSISAPMLPLGISFFTFHAISLLVDVYKRNLREPVRMLDALLYVAFFPQLIAGPILRASQFIPQLSKAPDRRRIRLNRALLLIVAGLFKKVIISNVLATRLVEPVFQSPGDFARWDTLISIYGYAAQIYCDFSGYTDIATGCAMLLGYRFPRNFNAPYKARSPQEFWNRWHISLSGWLRDYLYIPLGGNRKGEVRTYCNLMITMLLGGLWHGASWSFVIWGALQGSYLVIHRLWTTWHHPKVDWLRSLSAWDWFARILLFHTICLGWVFFRSKDLAQAHFVLSRLSVSGHPALLSYSLGVVLLLGLFGQYLPAFCRRTLESTMSRTPVIVTGAAFAFAVYLIEILGPTGVAPFIYFQF